MIQTGSPSARPAFVLARMTIWLPAITFDLFLATSVACNADLLSLHSGKFHDFDGVDPGFSNSGATGTCLRAVREARVAGEGE